MMYFCTLFDSYYLNRGVVMYKSLLKTCPDFHLYIFAFDDNSKKILEDMRLQKATVVSLKEFENEKLLRAKSNRTKAEYCWTCTPSVIEYCLIQYDIFECTYIDADLYFFNNPAPLLKELQKNSVLITSHRYTKEYDDSVTSGIYCVQFITFRNDLNGRQVLSWWRDRCIEWCYARFEDGKFGDQKYLDNWPIQFKGVHLLKHEGGGVAPWNIQQYDLVQDERGISIVNKFTSKIDELIFYHFHAVKFLKNNKIDLGSYKLSSNSKELYKIYIREINEVDQYLMKLGFEKIEQPYKSKKYFPPFVHKLVRRVVGVYNIMNFR